MEAGYVFFAIICGAFCAYIGNRNGRNEWLAAVLGLVFGLLAVIGYLIVGKTDEKKAEDFRKLQAAVDAGAGLGGGVKSDTTKTEIK